MITNMLKVTTLLPSIVSLIILGAIISFSTQFFADSEFIYNNSNLPTHCTEETSSSECIPPIESEVRGFPVRYEATLFEYGETTQEEGVPMTEVHTDNVFYWTHFIINSLIWSGISFVVAVAIVNFVNIFLKTNRKFNR